MNVNKVLIWVGVLVFYASQWLIAQESIPQNGQQKKEWILIQKMNGTFAKIKKLNARDLAGCPFSLETSTSTYVFETQDLRDDFKACEDLAGAACEHVETESLNQVNARSQKFFEALDTVLKKQKKGEDKLAIVRKSNPWMGITAEQSVRNHLRYLQQEGRQKTLDLFKQQYAKNNLGLTTLLRKQDTFMAVLESGLGYYPSAFQRFKLNAAIHKGEERVVLEAWYETIFQNATSEQLETFIRDFLYMQFYAYLSDIEEQVVQIPEFQDALISTFVPLKKKERLLALLDEAKKDMKRFLQTPRLFSAGSPLQEVAQKKIADLSLAWKTKNHHWYQMAIEPNAFYEPTDNAILFTFPTIERNEWSIYNTMAHELGHAIDPDAFHKDYELTLPQQRVGIDFSPWNEHWRAIRQCLSQAPYDISSNQMQEAFADWIATELNLRRITELPLKPNEKKQALLKSVEDLCESANRKESEQVSHPRVRQRIGLILRAHPMTNDLFGCSDSPPYCRWEDR
ncbi:MAG: hypothetical protein HY390_02840 [Deltaproteobacteria bacterium]|nr:hypothetical protein [Deltaproteobacteria bacterium]